MLDKINDNTLLQLTMILTSISDDVCFVGGSVRNHLINDIHGTNYKIKDYDIVMKGDLDVISKELTDNGWKVSETGKNFLVLVASKNDKQYDIALYRKDGTYENGRRPESVDVGTIEEDAERRDLTINALYYSLTEHKVLDPTGRGIQDIKDRKIRMVGKAKDRIKEDQLRIMRVYRFASQFNFDIDSKTLTVCRQYFADMVKNVSAERIRLEVERML